MKALIIEDHDDLSCFLAKGLGYEGFFTDIAKDGVIAIDKIKKNNYDIFILDLLLPQLNGTEVCKYIIEKGIKAPILVLSALADHEKIVKLLNLGASDYVTKPFSFNELLARIQALLRRREKKYFEAQKRYFESEIPNNKQYIFRSFFEGIKNLAANYDNSFQISIDDTDEKQIIFAITWKNETGKKLANKLFSEYIKNVHHFEKTGELKILPPSSTQSPEFIENQLRSDISHFWENLRREKLKTIAQGTAEHLTKRTIKENTENTQLLLESVIDKFQHTTGGSHGKNVIIINNFGGKIGTIETGDIQDNSETAIHTFFQSYINEMDNDLEQIIRMTNKFKTVLPNTDQFINEAQRIKKELQENKSDIKRKQTLKRFVQLIQNGFNLFNSATKTLKNVSFFQLMWKKYKDHIIALGIKIGDKIGEIIL